MNMRHTPYAANEDEAKDYELDRLERNRGITESEVMYPSYECPQCNDWIEIGPGKEKGTFNCPSCGEVLRLDADAEFRDGSWHDLSKLVTAGSHWDE
jgi:transcription initiation factor IIE alpha subunit